MESKTLRECPMCNGPAGVIINDTTSPFGKHDTLYRVACRVRECQLSTLEWFLESAAVTAWNTRANHPCPAPLGEDEAVELAAEYAGKIGANKHEIADWKLGWKFMYRALAPYLTVAKPGVDKYELAKKVEWRGSKEDFITDILHELAHPQGGEVK